MPTLLYDYNIETGEYEGSHEAQKRPNGEVILEALGATSVAPPDIPDGYAAVWTDEKWLLVEDHRRKYDERGVKTGGTPYWLEGDTYQTAARYMTELGPLPDGALLVQPAEPEPTLDEAKATKVAEIKAAFDTVAANGYTTSSCGYRIDATTTSLGDVQGLMRMINAGKITEPVQFRDYDNIFHECSLSDLAQFEMEITAHGVAVYADKWSLEAAVTAAETVEVVQSIDAHSIRGYDWEE